MSTRHSVLIPMIAPSADQSGDDGHLLEVYSILYGVQDGSHTQASVVSEDSNQKQRIDEKALDKYWDLVAAPLRTSGAALYRAGCAAVSAVRKLGLTVPYSALYQRFRPQAWIEAQRLYAASPEGPTEGRSAELGLALALLMGAGLSRGRCVIATGALTGASSRIKTDDVEILPVAGLPEKLNTVLRLAERGALPELGARSNPVVLTPRTFERGGSQHVVSGLRVIAELEANGVRVVPVGWLSEAKTVLGIRHARYLRIDRYLQMACAALVVLALSICSWLWWKNAPIEMAFLPGASAAKAEPFHACFAKDRDYYIMKAVSRDGPVNVVRSGETLGWKVRIGDPESLDAGIAGLIGTTDIYYVANAMVAENSEAKIVALPTPVRAGETVEWGWTLNERTETNALVLLVRRGRPFDADDIRERLFARFPNAAGGTSRLDITGAANYLMQSAPGALKFVFQTRQNGPECPI